MMKSNFDNIIQKLLSKLPQHTPRAYVWQKINQELDDNLAMSRLRETLKNNVYEPKQKIWSNIEAQLDKSIIRKPFYSRQFFKISLSSFVLIFIAVLFLLLKKNPDTVPLTAKTEYQNRKEAPLNHTKPVDLNKPENGQNKDAGTWLPNLNRKSDHGKKQNLSPAIAKNNPDISENTNNSKQNTVIANIYETAINNDSQNSIQNSNKGIQPEETLADNGIAALEKKEDMMKIQVIYCNALPLPYNLSASFIDTTFNSGTMSCGKPAPGLGQGNVSLELSYSPEISFAKLSNNPKNDIGLDLLKRNHSELPTYSYTYGAEAKVDFRHWFFQSGINLSNILSTANFTYRYFHNDTISWILSDTVIINEHIDTTGGQYDTVPAQILYSWLPFTQLNSYDKVKKATIEIKYLQIPILVGYSFSTKKIIYSVSTGISIGFPISIKGEILSLANKIEDVSKLAIPLRKPVFNYLLRAGATYVVSSRYSVFIQPSLRYSLNSVFNKSYPVNQKYTVLGLRMGLLYRF
ncbi:MAG: hypothetical protein WC868_10630 [Bacteroidales bacterium]